MAITEGQPKAPTPDPPEVDHRVTVILRDGREIQFADRGDYLAWLVVCKQMNVQVPHDKVQKEEGTLASAGGQPGADKHPQDTMEE